jgi:1,4-dihydroxy-2-naphthoate octaprenyltransferase
VPDGDVTLIDNQHSSITQMTNLPPAGSWRCWILAARPATLSAAFAPVMLGTSLAWREEAFHLLAAICALAGAVLIQIGTNLANDTFDAKKGADTAERLGPIRVCSAGLLPTHLVWKATIFVFALSLLPGIYLVWRAGWPIAVLGMVSIACGIGYTAGRHSLAYLGLGDLFTFVFFGLIATFGTFYVQALSWSPAAALFGVVPGLYSVALIAINNLRDREQDILANKKTLAVRIGDRATRWQITTCLLLPAAAPWVISGMPDSLATIGSLVALVAARPVLAPLLKGASGRDLNPLLRKTSIANLCFCFLLSVFLIR